MQPSESYWSKHLLKAAIDETKEAYTRQGYSVKEQAKIGEFYADLIASKDNHEIIFEFQARGVPGRSNEQLLSMTKLAKTRPNAELKLVYVEPPASLHVEVEEIETVIEHEIMNDMPSELDSLSTHTFIDEVSDVEFDRIHIAKDSISLDGTCNISVQLQYGSDNDVERGEGAVSSDSFIAKFQLEMDGNYNVEHFEISVDTSSFYGEAESDENEPETEEN